MKSNTINIIRDMEPSAILEFPYEQSPYIRVICSRLGGGYTVNKRGLKVVVTKKKQEVTDKSFASDIKKILLSFTGEQLHIPFPAESIRPIVSSYNKKHNTRLRVKSGDPGCYIWQAMEDREQITQEEFNEIEREALTRLEDLRRKIKKNWV